jgi:hypothetical protein
MEPQVSSLEAQAALDAVERGRLRVIDEIDLPAWYWWGLAVGWIGLGLLNDVAADWVSGTATVIFGAVHASVAPRVVSGRRRSRSLSVRADVAPPHLARIVIGGLIVLAAVTVAGALAIRADGAEHPVTIASVFVALLIVLGGPRLLAAVRRRTVRGAVAA